MLRPGGRFIFLEPVLAADDDAAPTPSRGPGARAPRLRARLRARLRGALPLRARWPPLPLWAQQRLANAGCKLWYGGSRLDLDAERLLAGAHGELFASLQLSCFSLPRRGWRHLGWLRAPHCAGVAAKARAGEQQAAAAATPQQQRVAAKAPPGTEARGAALAVPARAPGTVTRPPTSP